MGGQAFDADATYTIVTNNFMAAGGDTYYAFSAASSSYDSGIPLDQVVMDYITEELDGTVTAARCNGPPTASTPSPTTTSPPVTGSPPT